MIRTIIPTHFCLCVIALMMLSATTEAADEAPKDDGKLRIIVFGAHPDDAEYRAGGCGVKWARLGHHVKLVSVTNGDIGHWAMSGGALAKRRTEEARKASEILGTTSEVMDIHDGELMPTLENRRKITRIIREWKADVVIAHRPWDYHPDHRYVGVLVQDASFMVAVPFFCPDVPALEKNPVFLYASDRFKKPYPFTPDIAVSIDDAFETKVKAIAELKSQVFEGGAMGSAETESEMPPERMEDLRLEYVRKAWKGRAGREASQYRNALVKLYGEERGNAVKYAEVFEICEYGHQPSEAEIKKLFPFFDASDETGKADSADVSVPANTLSETERKAGWKSLFDGKTADAWRAYRGETFPPQWKVTDDGTLVRVAGPNGKRGPRADLVTKDQYSNFRLELDWKIKPGGNGGVFFRIGEDTELVWHGAPEIQIMDDSAVKDHEADRGNGACYGLYPPTSDAANPPGQWNHFAIVANGNNIQHWLNGVKITEYMIGSGDWNRRVADSKFKEFPSFAKRTRGHLCLQDYGDEIAFRNIKILELPNAK